MGTKLNDVLDGPVTKTEFIFKETIQIPKTPACFRCANDSGTIPLSAFADCDLRRIAHIWTMNLLATAAEQRKQAKEGKALNADD